MNARVDFDKLMDRTECHTMGCGNTTPERDTPFCLECMKNFEVQYSAAEPTLHLETLAPDAVAEMAAKYPKYYKDVTHLTHVDVYQVHQLFAIDDPSGCLQHSSKKLLLSGVRTGGKPKYEDVKEARDTLTRWLQINAPE